MFTIKKTLTSLIVLVLFVSVVFEVQPVLVNANFLCTLPEITIKSDGTIEPETEYINHTGNIYTLTSDIKGKYAIVIKCSNIVLNGSGYSIDGSISSGSRYAVGYANNGLRLESVKNVTVRNLTVNGFMDKQVQVNDCYNCCFIGIKCEFDLRNGNSNSFFESNISGMLRSSKNNLIARSNISGLVLKVQMLLFI